MALQHTTNAAVFAAELPNKHIERYSFAEYLAWRESVGIPIEESEWTDWVTWMSAQNNNFGRIGAWISVRDFRANNPNDTAVVAFVKYRQENPGND